MLFEIPEGAHPIGHVWGNMVPEIGGAAVAFSSAVYEHSRLELEVFEAARLTIAGINGCQFCLDWRTDRNGERVSEDFITWVHDSKTDRLSPRAVHAIEYARRWATDHHGLDDSFWERMRATFSDVEIVELTMCLGSWLAFGRLNRVFGLDTACQLPSHTS